MVEAQWRPANIVAMPDMQSVTFHHITQAVQVTLPLTRIYTRSGLAQVENIAIRGGAWLSSAENPKSAFIADNFIRNPNQLPAASLFQDSRFAEVSIKIIEDFHSVLFLALLKVVIATERFSTILQIPSIPNSLTYQFLCQLQNSPTLDLWQSWEGWFATNQRQLAEEALAIYRCGWQRLTNGAFYQEALSAMTEEKDNIIHCWASMFDVAVVMISNEQETYYFPNSGSSVVPAVFVSNQSHMKVICYPHFSRASLDRGISYGNCFYHIVNNIQLACLNSRGRTAEGCQIAGVKIIAMIDKLKDRERSASGRQNLNVRLDPIATSFERIKLNIDEYCHICSKKPCYTLRCGDKLCDECATKQLSELTQVYCSQHDIYFNLEPSTLSVTALRALNRQSSVISCTKCERNVVAQFVPGKASTIMEMECGDWLCMGCREAAVRMRKNECPVCECRVDMQEGDFASMNAKCAGCEVEGSAITLFTDVVCEGHRYCRKCSSQFLRIDHCRFSSCRREFRPEEKQHLRLLRQWSCKVCGQNLREQKDVWEIPSRSCECLVCSPCMARHLTATLEIDRCALRKQPCGYSEELLFRQYQQLTKIPVMSLDCEELRECVKDLERRKGGHPMCAWCEGFLIVKKDIAFTGECGHRIHRTCLSEYISNIVDDIMTNKKRQNLKCIGRNCTALLNTSHLTGNFALISDELYNRFNEYFALEVLSLEVECFQCTRKNLLSFDEEDQSHIRCECGRNQCVQCGGEWTEEHNRVACLFNMREKMIGEVFKQKCEACGGAGCETCAIAQCPNCKFPMMKETGCDHVTCQMPDCRTEFCFGCAAFYLPIKEHSQLWHRPDCRLFPSNLSEAEIDQLERGTEKKEKCSQCVKAGKLCARPPRLLTKQRFALSEY